MADFGYDVADYCDVDPRFGTLADFDALMARGARARLARHPRLRPEPHLRPAPLVRAEPQRRAADPKRDWYLWRDPAPDGGPPNNWLSNFGGPAWTFDAGYRPVLLPLVPEGAARPELAQPRGARRDVRRAALLAAARRRRISRRRDLSPDQGRRVPRQPRRTRRSLRAATRRTGCCRVYTADRPEVQDIVLEMRRVLDEFGTPDRRAC